MKRIMILLMLFAVLSSLFSGCATVEECTFSYDSYDSQLAPDVIKETVAYQENKTSLRIYVWDLGLFATKKSIEEYLPSCRSYYLVESPTNWIKYDIENGKARRIGSQRSVGHFTKTDAIRAVSPDIYIENMYCFYSSIGYGDYTVAIYYKTDLGDYVYFAAREYDPMLMCAEQYHEFLYEWRKYQREQQELHNTPTAGRSKLKGDWSVYDWNSPNFDPDAPLPIEKTEEEPMFPWVFVGIGAVVLAATVTTILLIRKKKKKKAEETTAAEIIQNE